MMLSKALKGFQQKSVLQKRRIYSLVVVFLYIIGTLIVRQYYYYGSPTNPFGSSTQSRIEINQQQILSLRKLLSNDVGTSNDSSEDFKNCTKPSIEEFPRDLFTMQERRSGAILLHLFLAVYMFVALALVCDDYFVSSLEKICEHFNLSEDVAGATFMAAGSSAPELFTAVISVFIAKGDVGLGTIVGSAVFNILVIIALCSLFAGQVIYLTWWPLCRDCAYYSLAIAALFYSIHDGVVTWHESLVMVILYSGYILLMKLNPRIVAYIEQRNQNRQMTKTDATSDLPRKDVESNIESGNNVSVTYVDGKYPDNDVERIEMNERKRLTWKELALMMMLTDKFSPTTRFRAACLMIIHREENKKLQQQAGASTNAAPANTPDNNDETEEASAEDESVFIFPSGSPLRIIGWLLSLPLVTLMYITIPDCRKEKWEKWWPCTFFFSIFWIMIFSYIMVWMVCMIGFTIGVPDVIMGIIFLAAGTSIPDAIASLLVAREGMGDMAVSNSIGSNIFDILIGLAIPWFIKSAIYDPGKEVHINSRGMVYSVVLLFASVILTVFSIYCNKWCLDRKLGLLLSALYIVFITLSACIEFNVFTFVNFPACNYDG